MVGEVTGAMGASCTCAEEETVAGACAAEVEALAVRLRRHFRRREASAHAADYLRGLLADVERKNGWQLAERVGYAHPRGIQRVLDRYAWDADAVRDDLRAYVMAELGDPAGVLVVDETGFPKQGQHSAGVARQYSGSLGKHNDPQSSRERNITAERPESVISGQLLPRDRGEPTTAQRRSTRRRKPAD